MKHAPNILVIRNDKLGDFMLIWPALSLLKKQYPECSITVLVPAYTQPMAQICPWIDEVILDDQHNSLFSDAYELSKIFSLKHFDASISMYTEARTALATFLSFIPQRISPATKVAQIYSNRRLRQRRSESAKPEHEYNTDLVRYFIQLQGDTPVPLQQPPYLVFEPATINHLRDNYCRQHNIVSGTTLIIVHPGSGGSAVNLSTTQYAELIRQNASNRNVHFIITSGPDEINTAHALSSLIMDVEHSVYISTQGLVSFSQFIAMCDLFISGSTGPLHIAGALNIATAAFYSARKSATSIRWQTLNQSSKRIAFSPKEYTGEADMNTLDIKACGDKIYGYVNSLPINNK